jgi:pyruvate/2-oxoglutarate dehydrogenase complex dihydrolipoamide acyltransferase (E2) component
MKMQHTVSAPHAGVVAEIDVTAGTQVASGSVLAVVTAAGAEASPAPAPTTDPSQGESP